MLFLLLVYLRWPEGAGLLGAALADAECSGTAGALDCLATKFMNSVSVADVISEFFSYGLG